MNNKLINMNKKRLFAITFLSVLFCLSIFTFVFAADDTGGGSDGVTANSPTGIVKLDDPLGTTDVTVLFGRIIKYALGFMGGAALLAFVVGGIYWLTSAGNAEQVKKGTTTMVWAVIGIFIIFSSYAILSLVFKGLTGSEEGVKPTGSDSESWTVCTDKKGFSCQDIKDCGLELGTEKNVDAQRGICDKSDTCATGKCNEKGQGKNIVCCSNPPSQSNKTSCCVEKDGNNDCFVTDDKISCEAIGEFKDTSCDKTPECVGRQIL